VNLSANASDNVGVVGVQFKVDGANLGAEDTSSPYSVSWNTTTVANGSHTLTAVARDAASNTTTSSVNVTVANTLASTTTPITVGADPTAVVISGNRAYVANQGDNTVSVIDTTTKRAVATIPVGTGPNSLVATRDGTRVYVANSAYNGANTVSVIDTTTNQVVATIPIPNQNPSTYGYDLAVSPDGTRVYVAYQYDPRISVIDANPTSPRYSTVISTTNVGYYGNGDIKVTPDGTRIYRASDSYGDVVVIDTATMTPVGSVTGPGQDGFYPQALAISPDGKRAYAPAGYVTEGGLAYSEVSVIDTDPTSATYNTQIATISLPTDSSGLFYSDYGGVFDVAFSPDGKRAYVTSFDGKTTTVIDTASNTVIGSFTIDEGPADSNLHRSLAVAADGTLYIADGDGTVYAVTVSNPTML
jgi:YVTN family beta-propeller protein